MPLYAARTYFAYSSRVLLTAVAVLVGALALPAFQLFEDRAASMLQLHLLLEMFSVIVALLVAVVSWHSFDREHPNESAMLMAGFGMVAAFDLLHALTYDGMPPLLTPNSTPKAIFFWFAGRTAALLTLALVALDLKRPLPRSAWLAAAGLVTGLTFWVGTFHLDMVPLTFVRGLGVTPFKTAYEYGLLLADALVALVFVWRAGPERRSRAYGLATACLVMGLGEVVFAHYKAPSDFLNIFGHVFKVASYVFLYRTIFVSAIREPYEQARTAEAELGRLNAELEQRVQERTGQLEKANRDLGEFSYIVSHDLKAPLRGITSLVTWIEQDYGGKLDDEGREMLRLLGQRSQRMHRLIEDVLEYSRVGRVRETAVAVDLGALVHDIVDSIAVPSHIEVRVEGQLPVLTGELTRLQQVFQNLLSNAVKYIDKPHGHVNVSCEPQAACWRFCVADNGPGIDPKHHERIFGVFQTLGHSREDPDSTGIGLSIVKKIVEAYDGKIWLESELGVGSRFYFELPRDMTREMTRHEPAAR
jgi:signal transduction histidine kinase